MRGQIKEEKDAKQASFHTNKLKFGTTSFWIQKQDNGKYHFQMDSCESDLSRKDLKKLAAEIEKCLSE